MYTSEKNGYIYTIGYYVAIKKALKKEENMTFWDNMDGSEG